MAAQRVEQPPPHTQQGGRPRVLTSTSSWTGVSPDQEPPPPATTRRPQCDAADCREREGLDETAVESRHHGTVETRWVWASRISSILRC